MKLDSQLAVLKTEIESNQVVLQKLGDNLLHLSNVAADIKQILAVHDEKIEQHERKQEDIVSLIEQRRSEMSEDIKDLHSRITTVQRELCSEITNTEKRIVSGIDDLKKDLKEDQLFHNQKQKSLDDRISELERWKYILVGAGIAGGFLLTKVTSMFDIVIK